MCTGDNGFTRALLDNALEYRELNCGDRDVNEKAVAIGMTFKPNLVFLQVQTPNIIHPSTISALRSFGAWVCNFTGDVRQPLPQWYIDTGRLCHRTFFTNEADVAVLQQLGIPAAYLNIGFDPAIYHPAPGLSAVPDIVFMANHYPGQFPLSGLREEVARKLTDVYGHRFGLYGSGWTFGRGNLMGFQNMEADVYRNCKIAINLSHFDLQRYSSDRILRIMGSGAFCLTKQFPGLEKDYADGEHLVTWQSMTDLVNLCDFYLANEQERRFIAEAGCKLAHSRDTFDHMVKNLIQFYEGQA